MLVSVRVLSVVVGISVGISGVTGCIFIVCLLALAFFIRCAAFVSWNRHDFSHRRPGMRVEWMTLSP